MASIWWRWMVAVGKNEIEKAVTLIVLEKGVERL